MKESIVAEKVLRIPLEELETVRIACRNENCGGTVEIPVVRLDALVAAVLCPSCGHPFAVKQIGQLGGLRALGMALKNLVGNETFGAEFVIVDPTA